LSYKIKEILTNKDVNIKVLRYSNQGVNHLDLSIFNALELSKYKSYKSDKRKLEFYYSRVLWHSFNIDFQIEYKPTGKPILKKGFISISHSHHKIAIAFSKTKNIGVDIEYRSNKVQKIKHKFLHDTEQYETIKDLTAIWTIKEAIYKLYDTDKLFFKEHIVVSLMAEKPHVSVEIESKINKPNLSVFHINDTYVLSLAI